MRRGHGSRYTQLLYVQEVGTGRRLFGRLVLILLGLALATLVFWFERHNLRDANGNGPMGLADVLYFTMVTVTTTGYGDIVPVGERARLVDALVITPIRLFIWLMFIGTAYEFFWQRFVEDRRMRKLQENLRDHVIVCGYGYAGSSAARALASPECGAHQVVVIDNVPERLEEVAEAGHIGLRGDCTRDIVQQQAGIATAKAILFCIRSDEIVALATLTARNLNAGIRILAQVRDQENLRLVQRAGAQEVVAPSRLAGYLMADAVNSRYTNRFISDLLAGHSGFVRIAERKVAGNEIGKCWGEIPGMLVVAIEREGRMIGFWEEPTLRTQAGDLLFAIEANPERPDARIETAPPL